MNPSPKESRLSYVVAPEALNLWQIPHDAVPPKPAVSPAAAASLTSILQQQIWWWLLLAALAALLAETFWAASKKEAVG